MAEGVSAESGEAAECKFSDSGMLSPVFDQSAPKFEGFPIFDSGFRGVGGKTAESPDSGNLAESQRPDLDGGHSTREVVMSLPNPQRGRASYDYSRGGEVSERLELDGPVRQILNLVEEQVCRSTFGGGGIERRLEDVLLEPAHDRFNRASE